MPVTLRRLGFVLIALGLASAPAAGQSEERDRVRNATTAFSEIMSAPDKAIPRSILDKAEAIVVVPSMVKAGFIFGANHGRGIISARDRAHGTWSPPAFMTLTGGSFGAQIGGEAVDVVLIVMSRRGLERLVSNQFKLGADASVAGGPVGRTAEASTDVQMRAEILSYSRSRGLFAGLTLNGSSLHQDRDANERFYGQAYKTRDIILDGRASVRPPAGDWIALLKRTAG